MQAPQTEMMNRLFQLITTLQSKRSMLEAALQKVEGTASEVEKAQVLAADVSRVMAEVRSTCDELESVVSDEVWPLPKYREMLFLS